MIIGQKIELYDSTLGKWVSATFIGKDSVGNVTGHLLAPNGSHVINEFSNEPVTVIAHDNNQVYIFENICCMCGKYFEQL